MRIVVLFLVALCWRIGEAQFKCPEKQCILRRAPPDRRADPVNPGSGYGSYGCAPGNTLTVPRRDGITEVHVLGVYEPVGGQRAFQQQPNVVGKVRVKLNTRPDHVAAGRMALILLSYEAVEWEIEAADVDFIKEIEIYSYYYSHSSVTFISQPSQQPIIRKRSRYYGYARNSIKIAPLLRILRNKYGVLTSITGIYKAGGFNLYVGSKCQDANQQSPDSPITTVTGCLSAPNRCWVKYDFQTPNTWNDCSRGAKYVKRSGYSNGMFLGVQLCTSIKYKLFMSNSFKTEFKHIADGSGHGQDHCELLNPNIARSRAWASSERLFESPNTQGYYRYTWGEQFQYGAIGLSPTWSGKYITRVYKCGAAVPGNHTVVDYDGSLDIGVVTNTPSLPPTRPQPSTTTPSTAAPPVSSLVFNRKPSNHSVDIGDRVILQCSTVQQTNIRWFHNGRHLTASTGRVRVLPGGVLIVPRVDMALFGKYTCVAATSSGESATVIGWIKAKQASNVCSVAFQKRPSNTVQEIGDWVTLECTARSAQITWKKNEVPLRVSNSADYTSGRITQLVNGYLLIDNLRASDDGLYKCVAKTSAGCSSEAQARLTIKQEVNINTICGRPILNSPRYNIHRAATSRGRIVGGENAPKGSAPWFVQLYSDEVKQTKGWCGAVLLNNKWVATAAHCIHDFKKIHKRNESLTPLNFKMKMGLNDAMIRESSERHEYAKDGGIIIHEHFNSSTFDNDIALIELQTEISFNDYITPICISTMTTYTTTFFTPAGQYGVAVGFGREGTGGPLPRFLKEVSLPLVDKATCASSTRYPTTDNMFCAGFDRVMMDTCQGDSGGPFVMKDGDTWFLVGIVSWGEGCAQAGQYGFYTNVGKYYSWIQQKIGSS